MRILIQKNPQTLYESLVENTIEEKYKPKPYNEIIKRTASNYCYKKSKYKRETGQNHNFYKKAQNRTTKSSQMKDNKILTN